MLSNLVRVRDLRCNLRHWFGTWQRYNTLPGTREAHTLHGDCGGWLYVGRRRHSLQQSMALSMLELNL